MKRTRIFSDRLIEGGYFYPEIGLVLMDDPHKAISFFVHKGIEPPDDEEVAATPIDQETYSILERKRREIVEPGAETRTDPRFQQSVVPLMRPARNSFSPREGWNTSAHPDVPVEMVPAPAGEAVPTEGITGLPPATLTLMLRTPGLVIDNAVRQEIQAELQRRGFDPSGMPLPRSDAEIEAGRESSILREAALRKQVAGPTQSAQPDVPVARTTDQLLKWIGGDPNEFGPRFGPELPNPDTGARAVPPEFLPPTPLPTIDVNTLGKDVGKKADGGMGTGDTMGSVANLLQALSGVVAPPEPQVPYVATPGPPSPTKIDTGNLAQLLTLIMGEQGTPSAPLRLNQALRT